MVITSTELVVCPYPGISSIIIVDVFMMDWLICIISGIGWIRLTAKDQQWTIGSECYSQLVAARYIDHDSTRQLPWQEAKHSEIVRLVFKFV